MNNDDLDDELDIGSELDSEDGFDEFSQKSGLGDIIRHNPLAKVVVVVGALALVISVMVLFGGKEEADSISVLPTGSEVVSTPGSGQVIAPAYIDAVEEQNEADLDIAIATGRSAIPVPIETPDTRLDMPNVEGQAEDPLHRWRMLQEERVKRQIQANEIEEEPVTVLDAEQQAEAVRNMAESMVEQMQSVLERNSKEVALTSKTLITNLEEELTAANAIGMGEKNAFSEENAKNETVVLPAGKIVYAQLLLEANSDVPVNVLAQMVSGPLKGWKLLGQFDVMDDAEMLAITFNMAVNDAGDQYAIDAIMLNPDTGLPAMRTDIDHRYFQRVVFPAAADFISGYADAVEESGATTVYVTGDTVVEAEGESTDKQEVAAGISEAGAGISDILDEMGDVDVKIVIDAGTPIGVFFLSNVVDTTGAEAETDGEK